MNIDDFEPGDLEEVEGGIPTAPLVQAPGSPESALSIYDFEPGDLEETSPYVALQESHGGIGQGALALGENLARGASLGFSDYLENKLEKDIPALSKENRLKRNEANPGLDFLGNVLGGAALLKATGGLSAPLETVTGTGLIGRTLGYGAEGAIFGAGTANSEFALSDEESLDADKVLAHMGSGAIFGAGLGAISKGIESAAPLLRRAEKVKSTEGPSIIDAMLTPAADPIEGLTSVGPASERPYTGKPLKSLGEIEKRLKNVDLDKNIELPQKQPAEAAARDLNSDLEFPITEYQLNSLGSKDLRSNYQQILEVPGKSGEVLRNLESAQKYDLIRVLDKSIEDIAPGYKPTSNAQVAGERVSDALTEVIQGTRASLGPAFKQIKSTPLDSIDHLGGVIRYLTDPAASPRGNPKLANMFDHTGEQFKVKPKYYTGMGIDHATYKAVKQAVESLEQNPRNFEQLIDIRDGMSQNIDVTKLGKGPAQVAQAKAAMMDYIQDAVQAYDPSISVRETFKKWAQNEEAALFIEKRLGAEIGTANFRSLAKGKPDEAILGNIFRNSEVVKAVKDLLPPEKFKELLSDYMTILKKNATKDNVFSSKNMSRNFTTGEYALNEAFKDAPGPYKKIVDSLTLMRIFPDTLPKNPSGTAKTVFQPLEKTAFKPSSVIGEAGSLIKSKVQENILDKIKAKDINEQLSGVSDRAKKMNALRGVIDKVTSKIESGSKSILSPGGRGGIFGGSVPVMSDKKFEEIQDQLNEIAKDPESFVESIGDSTSILYNTAPGVTQDISTGIMESVSFLTAKLPKPPDQLPFSTSWKPTNQQKAQFSQYYKAIDDPLNVYAQVKHGTINNNTMEALQLVYPKLLEAMRIQVLQDMDIDRAKKLPYWQKLSLAKFLGQPLDGNMTTLGITANQLALNAPSQSNQTSEAQARKAPVGALKQLNLASRSATQTRREKNEE